MFKFFTTQPNTNTISDLPVFKQAVESSTNHIIMTDINGFITYANKSAQQITGYTFSEMQGNTPRLWGGIMPAEFYKNLWKTIKQDRQPFVGEIQNIRKNGEMYTSFTRISPIVNMENNLTGFVGTEEDITIRVNLEKQLKSYNEALVQAKKQDEAILTSIGDGVVVTDNSGVVILANPVAAEMLGFGINELVGKKYFDVVATEDKDGQKIPEEKRGAMLALSEKKKVRETSIFVRKDGSKFFADVTNEPVFSHNKLFGNIAVLRDVTAEREIDKAKSEFISLASHQLRTPLSAMKWFAEMLLAGDAGKLMPEQKEYIQNIYDSNQRLIDLVGSLLNISRIESGRLIIELAPTDLRELVTSVLGDVKTKIEEKKMKISVKVSDALPKINIDPKLIYQVYTNLLTNSIKYTDTKGEIIISIFKKGNEIISQISDTGYGIPKNDQAKVFSKFFRADNIVKVVTEGTGLGLYLIKMIVESSGGKIWFESEENKGTTFWFSLPITGSKAHKGEVALGS